MSFRSICYTALLALILSACGGDAPELQTRHSATRAMVRGAVDTVEFADLRANYTIARTASGYAVTPLAGGTVVNVAAGARLRFKDATVSFDATGISAQVYRIYQSAFNRAPDPGGVGFWIKARDDGYSLQQVAIFMMDSTEFRTLYGSAPTNQELVEKFYLNVLQRAGEPGGVAFWKGVLDNKTASVADVLVAISEGSENQANVLARIEAGIQYQEPGQAYAPIAHAGPDTDIGIQRTVTLDGTGSTGKTLSYQWTLQTKPAGSNAVLSLQNTARPSFTTDLPGSYVVSLLVNDGSNSSSATSVRLNANWSAPAKSIPAAGNYVYLEGDTDYYFGGGNGISYAGGGAPRLYTAANALLKLANDGGQFGVIVAGGESWRGDFAVTEGMAKIETGFYGDLLAYPNFAPAKAAMKWLANRQCSSVSGWFIIDKLTYRSGELTGIDLRFEQRCGDDDALRGQVHISGDASVRAFVPVLPEPAGLWSPSPDRIPANGNYAYFARPPMNNGGDVNEYHYTDENSFVRVFQADRRSVKVLLFGKFDSWSVDLVAMNTIERLERGYYGAVPNSSMQSVLRGGMIISSDRMTRCRVLSGWFFVDSVTYAGDEITALDARLEHYCNGSAQPWRAKIRWTKPV